MVHPKIYTVFYILLSVLIWTGCSDVLTPLNPGVKGLKITISGDAVGSRTLYPEVSFTKYVLSFEGPSDHADVTLQADTTSVIVDDLVVGEWTITATGYVRVSGTERAAAVGSAEVTIEFGAVQNLTIPISAQQESGVNGFFSYSITYPRTRANYGYIELQPFNNSELSWGYDYLGESPATGAFSLVPGFYVMTIRLYDNYRDVIRAEIVHIFSNLETKAEYTFRDEDFNDSFILSGTLDVTVNGDPLTSFSDSAYANIYAYLNPYGNQIGSGWVNLEDKTWSMVIPVFDDNVTLSFSTYAYIEGSSFYQNIDAPPVTVKNQNKSVNLGAVDIRAIYLTGTINVTYDGKPMSNVEISAYGPRSGYTTISSPGPNAPWSILIQAFDEPADITFGVRGSQYHYYDDYDYYSEQIFSRNAENLVTAADQDISGITITLGDFPNAFVPVNIKPLTENTWVDDDITESYAADWYSINAAAGTTYNLWWNHSWDGNYTKSLAVDVYAWYSDGTPVRLTSNVYAWSNPASFTARSNGTIYLRVRSYHGDSGTGTYGIVYNTDDDRPGIGEFSGSLVQKLQWIKDNTEDGDEYILEVTANESIDPQHLYYGGRTVNITIRGNAVEREISLNGTGPMFTVNSGVTLILEDITLRGHNGNTDALVVSYGDLEIYNGVTITGNTVDYSGGGVYVSGGTVTMNGGTITGNTAYYGGGVYVGWRGTFFMSGGVISGNTAQNSGGGVFVSDGTFHKTGGTIYGYADEDTDSNTVKDSSDMVQDNRGHAAYAYYSAAGGDGEKRRETTAGTAVILTFNGTASRPVWSGEWDDE